jgi:DNA-binding beta-propeller fold protein YncE
LVGGFNAGRLMRLSTASGTIVGVSVTSRWPYDMAIDGTRGLVFTAGLDDGEIDVIDLASFVRVRRFPLPARPIRVALSADRTRLFATTLTDTRLVTLDAVTGAVQGGSLDIGGIGNGLALSPDGQRLWVTTTDGRLHVVTAATLAIERTTNLGGVPQDVVLSADGLRAYVANELGWVNAIDATSGTVVETYVVPRPFGLGLDPANARLWVTSARDRSIAVINLSSGQLVGTRTVGGTPRTIVFDGAGRAYIANEAGVVHIASPTP